MRVSNLRLKTSAAFDLASSDLASIQSLLEITTPERPLLLKRWLFYSGEIDWFEN